MRITENYYTIEGYKIYKEKSELRIAYDKAKNKMFYDEKKTTAKELLDFYRKLKAKGYNPKIEEIEIIC